MFDGISTFVLLLYVILLLLALIALTLFVLLVQSGIFTSIDDIKTGKPPVGQVVLAYKFNTGPYNQAGQLFTEAAIIAPRNRKIGIYYDDPNKVESSKLRYVVGSILSDDSNPVNADLVKQFTDKGFKMIHLPEVTFAVYTKFPHITTLSILIAVHKAYPRLHTYIEEHKLCAYPFLEYYDDGNIHFWAPLSRQEEFYVPECELTGGGDQPTTHWDSTAQTNTTQSSEDEFQVTQNELCSSVEIPESEPVMAVSTESAGEVATSNITNNSLPSEDLAGEEDQGSDDSSSSFELLKSELVGTAEQ